jgi:ribosome-associated toxin RatA of RatAB toxin-antitoxin module
MKCLSVIVLAGLCAAGVAGAADADRSHDHQGKLAPYEPGAIGVELSEKDLEKLAEDDLVIITIEDEDTGGRGIAIQDIAAPPDVVWSRITGYENYPEWVGPVKETEVYRTEGNDTYTRVKISGFLYKYEYYLHNTMHPDQDMLTWVLDYDRRSDFDDCVGAWYVEPHPEKEGWSRAWFSSDLKLRAKIPGFLMKFIKKKGLKDATAWVKEESEKAAGTHVRKSRHEYDPNDL